MKAPFDLNKWLSDKSQKVVTRDGRPVEILKTNMPGELPLLVLYDGNDIERVSTDGKYQIDYDGMNDLFLVTEDELKLTEFEEAVYGLLEEVRSFDEPFSCDELVEYVKKEAQKLLTIARKQIESESLKDLPKWKKAPRCHSPLAELLGDQLHYKGYYIKLSDLEKLPKE